MIHQGSIYRMPANLLYSKRISMRSPVIENYVTES